MGMMFECGCYTEEQPNNLQKKRCTDHGAPGLSLRDRPSKNDQIIYLERWQQKQANRTVPFGWYEKVQQENSELKQLLQQYFLCINAIEKILATKRKSKISKELFKEIKNFNLSR